MLDNLYVLDFGAAGNGTTNNVSAILKTIDTCTASGGGTGLFPARRTYFSGAFVLKPNVESRVEWGTILLASHRVKDYPPELGRLVITGGKIQENELPAKAFNVA